MAVDVTGQKNEMQIHIHESFLQRKMQKITGGLNYNFSQGISKTKNYSSSSKL